MKVAIIGQGKASLIEALVKAVEEKTGETVEFVNVHSEDIEELTSPIEMPKVDFKLTNYQIDYVPTIKDKKTKGHERPYKYHR